ncbi:TLC domain-containing protein 2 [Biomphalaria glabrata]|nr:TLC domain-containing protein 2-like [Biomphalaria glabrata]KAI8783049.1 TLC domain-containing protein 2 [Biomphalaria glabrata]
MLGLYFGEDSAYSHMRDNIDWKCGFLMFLFSLAFFYLVNILVKNRTQHKLPLAEEWKWRNVYVSWVHSLISATWTLLCVAIYPELFHGLIYHINYFTYLCITFATGYFVYDFLDLCFEGKVLTLWELTAHHIAVVSMFIYNVVTKAQIGFSLIALSVEVNSVFLHWRKLLQMEKTPFSSKHYVIIKYLNLATFIVFRGGPLTIITVSLFTLHEHVSLVYLVCVSISMVVMDIINIVLLYRFIKSDILRDLRPGTKKSSRAKHLNDRNGNVMDLEHDSN